MSYQLATHQVILKQENVKMQDFEQQIHLIMKKRLHIMKKNETDIKLLKKRRKKIKYYQIFLNDRV